MSNIFLKTSVLGLFLSVVTNPLFANHEEFKMPTPGCVENPSSDPGCYIPSEAELKKEGEYIYKLRSSITAKLDEAKEKQMTAIKRLNEIINDLNTRYGDENKLAIFYQDSIMIKFLGYYRGTVKMGTDLINDTIIIEGFLEKSASILKIPNNNERYAAYNQLYQEQRLMEDHRSELRYNTKEWHERSLDRFEKIISVEWDNIWKLPDPKGRGEIKFLNCDYDEIKIKLGRKRGQNDGSKLPDIFFTTGYVSEMEIFHAENLKKYEAFFAKNQYGYIPLTINCKQIDENQKKLPSYSPESRTLTVYYSKRITVSKNTSKSALYYMFGYDGLIIPQTNVTYYPKTEWDDIFEVMNLKK